MKVVWRDHWSTGHWHRIDQSLDFKIPLIESVGFFIGENKKTGGQGGIVLALNHQIDSDSIADTISILAPDIEQVELIRRA